MPHNVASWQAHSTHSALVRGWGAKQPRNAFGEEEMGWQEGATHILRSPHEGHLIQVAFSNYPQHPEFTRVRSTNWRAEYEPSGIYSTADARQFYAQLRAAGFEPVAAAPIEAQAAAEPNVARAM